MYAQYQYYQQPQVGSSASYWNGSEWVSASTATSGVSPGTYSTSYSTVATTQAAPAAVSAATNSATLVLQYTQYYHGWQAQLKEKQEYLKKLPLGSALRSEAQSHLEWIQYYSDQSSRAAHYFHENPTKPDGVPFDLPPPPPNNDASIGNVQQGMGKNGVAAPSASVATPTVSLARSSTSSNVSSGAPAAQQEEDDPSGLKRYVQNCLQQCTSQEQKREMQAEVEKVIAISLQDGTFHSKNWDAEPWLRLAGFARPSQPVGFKLTPQQKQNRPQQNDFQSRNGAGRSTFGSPFSKGNDGKVLQGGSYYGPTAPGNAISGPKGQQKLPSSDSYYGPYDGMDANTLNSNGNLGRRASNQSENSYGLNRYQNPSSPSSLYNPNLSFEKDVSTFESQQQNKRRPPGADENFVSFNTQQPPKKKQKVNTGFNIAIKDGFERSSSALAKRASRFNGPGGILDASSVLTTVDGTDQYMGKRLIGGSQKVLDEEDFEKMTVKGTCMKLEKEYLRLTAPPRAELVRPQPVLERHLENLKAEYALKQRRHDYLWFCSQLKAVRQDCTVQRMQDAFAVDVYETHAKIALEEGDLNEYNQCQTQLKELYDIHGSSSKGCRNLEEFLAYRLLYYVFLSTNETYDGGSSDLFKIMLSLTSEQSEHPAIAHACKVREAVALGDFLSFFRLHDACPNRGQYLTARIVPTVRYRAVQRIAKAYRPSVETNFCLRQLGFNESAAQQEEGVQWMESCGCVLEGNEFIAKDTIIHEPQAEKKNSLI
jgi:SAC3 family protein LENG8/THP3